jgi:hypothetical protein
MTYDPTHLPETDAILAVFLAQQAIQDDEKYMPTSVFHELGRLYTHCLIRDEVERREQRQRDAEVEDNRERAREVIRRYLANPDLPGRGEASAAAASLGWRPSREADDAHRIAAAAASDPRTVWTQSPRYARWHKDYVEPEWLDLAAGLTLGNALPTNCQPKD